MAGASVKKKKNVPTAEKAAITASPKITPEKSRLRKGCDSNCDLDGNILNPFKGVLVVFIADFSFTELLSRLRYSNSGISMSAEAKSNWSKSEFIDAQSL